MKFIGITGGVGAGKSAILDYLKNQYQSVIFLADDIAKEFLEKDSNYYKQIVDVFVKDVPDIVDENGDINRALMAKEIFSDDGKRQKINAMIHPAVKNEVITRVDLLRKEGKTKYVFLEAALLIEDHYDKVCDELWYIHTSEEVRRRRLKETRGYTDTKIDQIFASQLCEDVFYKNCKETIENSDSLEETYSQIDRLMKKLGE